MQTHLFVADFETYWDIDYSLSKMPAIRYIKDPRFEIQALSVYCPFIGYDTPVTIEVFRIPSFFEALRKVSHLLNLVGHNIMGFDAIIFAEYGIRFGDYTDTHILSKYRYGSRLMRHSLEAVSNELNLTLPHSYHQRVATELNIPISDLMQSKKASAALAATKGMTLVQMPRSLHKALEAYCEGDVWLTWQVYEALNRNKPPIVQSNMRHNINALLNMPLRLDVELLERLNDDYVEERTLRLAALWNVLPDDAKDHVTAQIGSRSRKRDVFSDAALMLKAVRSKELLADLFVALGAERDDLPVKVGKVGNIYAFSKSDIEFTQFAERYMGIPDKEMIPELVELRLDYQSSIYEKRTDTLAAVGRVTGERWAFHVQPYGAGNTGRTSGGNATGCSPQNLPRAKKLKNGVRLTGEEGIRDALCAPLGRSLVVMDSSGVELRCVGFITQEPNITTALLDKSRDLYCEFASQITGRTITKVDEKERFLGKIGMLSLQYLTGAAKLFHTATVWGNPISMTEAKTAHAAYRVFAPQVKQFWALAHNLMRYWAGMVDFELIASYLVRDEDNRLYLPGCRAIEVTRNGFAFPDDFHIVYPDLRYATNSAGFGAFSYWNGARKCRNNLHPGMVLENISQAIVTQIMNWAVDNILSDKSLPPSAVYVGQVHDEVIFTCLHDDEKATQTLIAHWMQQSPPWWPELVLGCEGGTGPVIFEAVGKRDLYQRYGACK